MKKYVLLAGLYLISLVFAIACGTAESKSSKESVKKNLDEIVVGTQKDPS